jgi:ketol-acid reductoisomerase
MRFSISDTAKYGDVVTGPRIINKAVRAEMKKVLKEIQNGKFATEWIKEATTGKKKKYTKLLAAGAAHPIEKTGARLRGLMPWIAKRNLGGAQASY